MFKLRILILEREILEIFPLYLTVDTVLMSKIVVCCTCFKLCYLSFTNKQQSVL